MATKQQMDQYEYQKLITLGLEGKLWAVSVRYTTNNDCKTHIRRNMLSSEVMEFRKNIFQFGFEVMVAPNHWRIICPMDINEVEMFRQTRYVPDGGTHIAGKPGQQGQPTG